MTELQKSEPSVYHETYQQIIIEAQAKARELRPTLPFLPSQEELEPFVGIMYTRDKPLIGAVRRHQEAWGEPAHGHGFEHLEWVATNGAFVAAMECEKRGIGGELRDEIIQRAWRLGLLHDLQRWRGFQKVHAIEGSIAARQILNELGIHDPYLPEQILVHDEVNIEPRNDPRFDIPLFSDFAVDHLLWGTEREETLWRGWDKKNIPPAEGIHDYQFLIRMRNSPNLQQTKWGREVAVPYLDYGIAIAKHVEKCFS